MEQVYPFIAKKITIESFVEIGKFMAEQRMMHLEKSGISRKLIANNTRG